MAIAGADLFFASAAELNAGWKKGDYSSEELTKAFLDRLERLGPDYNALATSVRKEALVKARDVDAERKRERFRGRLQGVPFGAKDLLAWPKYPTTWGAKPYASQVFEEPAVALQKLDGKGGVLVGKLAMVELAGGGGYRYAAASLTGPGLNPWNKGHWAGGSSSGSGAAVAAGLVPYALGSETSGSILTPAAYCGVTGLRPSYGIVSRTGAMALSWTLDKIGPLAHTAEDCGIILEAISGGEDGKAFHYAPQFARPMAQYTVGYAKADWEEWADPETRKVLGDALEVIRGLGVKMKEVELPDFPYGPLVSTIIQGESASIFEELIASGKVDELADGKQIAGLKAATELPAQDYLRAMRVRTQLLRAFREFFYEMDMVVSPTRFSVASRVDAALDAPRPSAGTSSKRGLAAHVPAGNLAGLPALSLPAGLVNGLPVAISLMGKAYTENALLAVGSQFQKKTNWHLLRPQNPL